MPQESVCRRAFSNLQICNLMHVQAGVQSNGFWPQTQACSWSEIQSRRGTITEGAKLISLKASRLRLCVADPMTNTCGTRRYQEHSQMLLHAQHALQQSLEMAMRSRTGCHKPSLAAPCLAGRSLQPVCTQSIRAGIMPMICE